MPVKVEINKSYIRKPLADMLPLNTPLGIDFHPSTYCNVKCIFCLHSSSNSLYDKIKNKTMSFETVKKAVDDMKEFPEKIKALHFCGLGEPLLNKDIAKMVAYTKTSNIAEKVDLNTNGILLTKKMVDELVASKIDFIRISLNGLSSEDFLEYTGVKVNFEKYIENIRYLFENRGNTKIYIKIFSFMVNTQEKKNFYYKTFEPLCDTISIEYYNECFKDTKGKDTLNDTALSQRGETLGIQRICSQPFFKMEIKPNGDVATCAEALSPIIIGNVNETSINKIWNNKKHKAFCLKMLDGIENTNPICRECTFIKVCNFTSDNLDNDAERLKKYYAD